MYVGSHRGGQEKVKGPLAGEGDHYAHSIGEGGGREGRGGWERGKRSLGGGRSDKYCTHIEDHGMYVATEGEKGPLAGEGGPLYTY